MLQNFHPRSWEFADRLGISGIVQAVLGISSEAYVTDLCKNTPII